MARLPSDLEALKSRVEANERFEYVFFFGHHPPKNGRVNQSCLSQWFEAPFSVDGTTFPTTEHWMMAQKAEVFGDAGARDRILAATSPAEAKKVGRGVRNFEDATWRAHRFEIVVAGNRHKFAQNEALRTYLASTKGKVLVEASPVDTIWGIGLPFDDKDAQDPRQWRGENLLGFALMQVRLELCGV